jgi:hypothetical protein
VGGYTRPSVGTRWLTTDSMAVHRFGDEQLATRLSYRFISLSLKVESPIRDQMYSPWA